MLAFILTMPNVNTWNNHWSGESSLYCKTMSERGVPKDIAGETYYYNFGDGWTAAVEVKKVTYKEAVQLNSKSQGFYGYDWMIKSIIKHKRIKPRKEI